MGVTLENEPLPFSIDPATDISFNPEIVLVAREPGEPTIPDEEDENRRSESLEEVRQKNITDAVWGTVEHALHLFKQVENSSFKSYFTQIRKCNTLDSKKDRQARNQCSGAGGDYTGYLCQEIQSLDPDLVVTLTTKRQNQLCKVFDLPNTQQKK